MPVSSNTHHGLGSKVSNVSPLTIPNAKLSVNQNLDGQSNGRKVEVSASENNNTLASLTLTNMPTTIISTPTTTTESTTKTEKSKSAAMLRQNELQQQQKPTLATISTNGSRIEMISSVKI